MSDTSASTVETTWQIALGNTRTIAYCLFVCLPALPMGFDASMLLALPQFREKFGYEYQGDYVVSATHQAIWNVVAVPGGFLGAALAGPIGDRLGRKYIFIIGSVVFISGTVQLQLSSEWKLMATGKFFSYTGIFMYLVAVPTYISEVAPLGIRGVMLTLVNFFSFVGGLISSCILQGTQNIPSNLSFRIPIILQYIVPFILLTCTWFIPESPPWLVESGRIELAKAALKQLHGKHCIDQHLHEIEKTISQQQKKASAITYIECFKGSNLRRTMIAVSILFAAQQVGMVFAYGYSTYFFILAGVQQKEAFMVSSVMFALQIAADMLSWPLIERFGRRPLLLVGTAAMCISHFVIAGVGTSSTFSVGPLPKVVVSFMVLFSISYQLSVGSAGWAVIGEVSSLALRAPTQSLTVAVGCIGGLPTLLGFPYLINPDKANLGPKVCYVFGSFTLIILVYFYYAIPEMKGRTYEELDYMFQKRIPTRKFKGFSVPIVVAEDEVSNGNEKLPQVKEVGL